MTPRTKSTPLVPEMPRDTLAYEMWMLRKTQEQIAKWESSNYKHENKGKNAHVFNAVLESFLVHARNLFEFYFAESPGPDDITVRDLLPERTSWSVASTREARGWRTDINKTVQHMTRSRVLPHINWDEPKIRAFFDSLLERLNAAGPIGGPVEIEHPDRLRRACEPTKS